MISVSASAYSDKDLEEMVDEDIERFSAYFQTLGNDPLSPFERSTIKTYLHWKTHAEATTPEETNA